MWGWLKALFRRPVELEDGLPDIPATDDPAPDEGDAG